MMRQDWSDNELTASVAAYEVMLEFDTRGKPYSKTQVYRDLIASHGRTKGAWEFRMQNISAVRDNMGLPWIAGLKPATNVGANVEPRLRKMVQAAAGMPANATAGKAPPPYRAKVPAIRQWLINIARAGKDVAYSEVMEAFGIDRFSLRHAMDKLGHQAQEQGEPIITALIVGKRSRKCSPGLFNEFGVADDELERSRLYTYWDAKTDTATAAPANEAIEVKAARFASVAVRPGQAKFRRVVFLANNGRCVISGCGVLEALDAAHRIGRDWRLGHNKPGDGYVLRKDLHALYDKRLLTIDEKGIVHLDPAIEKDFSDFVGRQVDT
jgi:hypothetical protein